MRRCPLVSIVVPVFNGERYLRESLDSILAQTHSSTEILVMDNASTDGTPEIVATYGARVGYYRQERNLGAFENINNGIVMARGEYIAIYHSDDVYHPSIVEREVEFLERHADAGAVFCVDVLIDPWGREVGRVRLPRDVPAGRPLPYPVIVNALLRHKNCFLRCPSSMVRAVVYRDVGGYRGKEFQESADVEMWLRISRKYAIGILGEYLLRYRHGHGNASGQYRHLRTDPERFFEIMDGYLEEGGLLLAQGDALASYEAHRAEDRLLRAVNCYILDRLDEAREILRQVRVAQIMMSREVQRWRLLVLFVLLRGLVRTWRMPGIARLFFRRWHSKSGQPEPCFRS